MKEEATIQPLLDCGPKLLFILLEKLKAQKLAEAVADNERVTVYPINLKQSLVKWAATVEEFEKINNLVPIVVRRQGHSFISQTQCDRGPDSNSGTDCADSDRDHYSAADYPSSHHAPPVDSLVNLLHRREFANIETQTAPSNEPLVHTVDSEPQPAPANDSPVNAVLFETQSVLAKYSPGERPDPAYLPVLANDLPNSSAAQGPIVDLAAENTHLAPNKRHDDANVTLSLANAHGPQMQPAGNPRTNRIVTPWNTFVILVALAVGVLLGGLSVWSVLAYDPTGKSTSI